MYNSFFFVKILFFIFHFQILYYLAYLFFFVHNLLHNKSKKLTIAMK
jgi:hypothetical protein